MRRPRADMCGDISGKRRTAEGRESVQRPSHQRFGQRSHQAQLKHQLPLQGAVPRKTPWESSCPERYCAFRCNTAVRRITDRSSIDGRRAISGSRSRSKHPKDDAVVTRGCGTTRAYLDRVNWRRSSVHPLSVAKTSDLAPLPCFWVWIRTTSSLSTTGRERAQKGWVLVGSFKRAQLSGERAEPHRFSSKVAVWRIWRKSSKS